MFAENSVAIVEKSEKSDIPDIDKKKHAHYTLLDYFIFRLICVKNSGKKATKQGYHFISKPLGTFPNPACKQLFPGILSIWKDCWCFVGELNLANFVLGML
eukprot:Gb_36387 [translate_table: standard]